MDYDLRIILIIFAIFPIALLLLWLNKIYTSVYSKSGKISEPKKHIRLKQTFYVIIHNLQIPLIVYLIFFNELEGFNYVFIFILSLVSVLTIYKSILVMKDHRNATWSLLQDKD